jgi:ABC-type nitrate/sulfonate/bicarbonate transport system substrate-binding protein
MSGNARRGGVLAALVLCALVALVVAGCGSSGSGSSSSGSEGGSTEAEGSSGSESGSSGEVQNVKFGLTSENMLYAPFVVAEQQGFFEKNGINLELVLTKEAATAEAAVATNSTPMGAIATSTIVLGHEKEPEVVIAQPVVKGTPYGLMVNSKYTTPESLKGQSLAASATKSGDGAIINQMLEHYGMKEGTDYTILVSGSPAARTASLQHGQVAGLATPEPDLSLLESEGFNDLIKAEEIPGLAEQPFTTIAVNKKWGEENPELVSDFQKAWNEGVEYMYDTSNEAELLPEFAKVFEVEPEVMKTAYKHWMVEQKVYSEGCEVPVKGLELVIKATEATGEMTGAAPKPEELLLPNACSE